MKEEERAIQLKVLQGRTPETMKCSILPLPNPLPACPRRSSSCSCPLALGGTCPHPAGGHEAQWAPRATARRASRMANTTRGCWPGMAPSCHPYPACSAKQGHQYCTVLYCTLRGGVFVGQDGKHHGVCWPGWRRSLPPALACHRKQGHQYCTVLYCTLRGGLVGQDGKHHGVVGQDGAILPPVLACSDNSDTNTVLYLYCTVL